MVYTAKLLQNIEEEGIIPNSFYKATVTLIPEPDKVLILPKCAGYFATMLKINVL